MPSMNRAVTCSFRRQSGHASDTPGAKSGASGASARSRTGSAVLSGAVTPALPQARPELAVAGVAQAGHDVALLVELPVERGAVDVDVGMRVGDGLDALRRGDEVDEADPLRAPALEHLDRGRRGTARGKHRVEDQADVDR